MSAKFEIIFDISSKFKSMNIQQVLYNNPHILNSTLKSNYGDIYFTSVFADLNKLLESAKYDGVDNSIIDRIKLKIKYELDVNNKLSQLYPDNDQSSDSEILLEADIMDDLKEDVVEKKFLRLLKYENIVTTVICGIFLYVDDIYINFPDILDSFLKKIVEWNEFGAGDIRFDLGMGRSKYPSIRGNINIRLWEWPNNITVKQFEQEMDEFIEDLKQYLVADPKKWKESVDNSVVTCLKCGSTEEGLLMGVICEKCYSKYLEQIES